MTTAATDRISKLLKLLEADPNDAFCLYGLAQEHAKTGRYDEALRFYDRTLAADPNYLYAYFHKARAQEAVGRRSDAQMTLREGLKRAQAVQDGKALNEMSEYLWSLET